MSQTSGNENPDFTGVYTHVRSENFEEFLAEVGLNWFVRKMASKSSPKYTIKQEGNDFSVLFATGFMNKEEKFTVGVDFDDKYYSGNDLRVSVKWEDGKLVEERVAKDPAKVASVKPQKVTKTINGDELVFIMEMGKVVCKRFFQRA